MPGFILGEKSEQSQMFDKKGNRIPTTFVKTTPCYLIDIKTVAKHGYSSLMLGFGQTKNIAKPNLGKLAKAGIKTPLRFLREFRLDQLVNVKVEGKTLMIGDLKLTVGEEIKPDLFFKTGDLVDVSGTSKGKGFQGVVKKHHFKGGPRTHGQSDRERAPGSIGMTTTPEEYLREKKWQEGWVEKE